MEKKRRRRRKTEGRGEEQDKGVVYNQEKQRSAISGGELLLASN